MKLNDKRFWIFEAIVLIGSLIGMVIAWANHFMLRPILFPAAFCFLFLVGGSIAPILSCTISYITKRVIIRDIQ